MKYEQFASKIEMIEQNLKLAMEQKQVQSESIIMNAAKELVENKDYALVFLASLETQLQEHHQEKDAHILKLTQDIELLKQKLEKEVTEYRKTHLVEEDKARLLTNKEEKLVEPRARKKKEIQEINQKITLLDKECLQILKENEMALAEEEKNFKQKLVELDRKMKFEVQKISDAILTPTTDDNPDQVGFINKNKAIEMRKNGINEIAKIKLKHYNEMRQMEIAFCNYKHKLKRDRGILREEYDKKIEELHYARKNHQIDLQKQIDMYDFDVYKNTNTFEKTYRFAENDIYLQFQDNLTAVQTDVMNVKKAKADINHLDYVGIYDQVKNYDINQMKVFDTHHQSQNQLTKEMFEKANEFMIDMLNTYENMVASILNHYWDVTYRQEQQLANAFVFLNYQTKLSSDFNYVSFKQELDQLLGDFKKRQTLRLDEFLQTVNDYFKSLLRQVSNLYHSINDYLDSEQKHLVNYQETLQQLIKKVHDKASEHLRLKHEQVHKGLQNDELHLYEEQKKAGDQLANQSKAIENDYFTKSNHLNDKIDAYNLTLKNNINRVKQEYQAFITKNKANINKFKANYKYELQTELSQIAHKYDTFIRDTEIECKTKLKMGQL
ncbi:MAG: hypothetical protein PHY42_04565 [Bacilli bacterium]|nr:hypothetical protein [Bacilli bacterium]